MTSTTDPTHAYAMLRFVDHLVYSTPDLDEGIHLVEQLFGTDVTPGGRHENWGTRNALVSLGEASYLEIIGPDPQRSIRQTPRLFNIDRVDRPRLVTWAAKGSNLTDIVASARSAGIDRGDVSHGNRLLPRRNHVALATDRPLLRPYRWHHPVLHRLGQHPRTRQRPSQPTANSSPSTWNTHTHRRPNSP